jgi:small subunit ribosomal protein S7e
MLLTTSKIVKQGDQKPTELESQVAQTLLDLEANTDLKQQLRELHITGAREVDISGGKKAVILFVPVPQLKSFQKIQIRLMRELEKKFSGKHFVIIAQVAYLFSCF